MHAGGSHCCVLKHGYLDSLSRLSLGRHLAAVRGGGTSWLVEECGCAVKKLHCIVCAQHLFVPCIKVTSEEKKPIGHLNDICSKLVMLVNPYASTHTYFFCKEYGSQQPVVAVFLLHNTNTVCKHTELQQTESPVAKYSTAVSRPVIIGSKTELGDSLLNLINS